MNPKNHPDSARGWHSRGYLPHFDAGSEFTQGVTFRLYDSLPEPVLEGWRKELVAKPAPQREADLRRLLNEYLDQGHGSCVLGDASIAEVMEGALEFGDGSRYDLHAWVIMPNHVRAVHPTKGLELVPDRRRLEIVRRS